jgi:hypothetical protein
MPDLHFTTLIEGSAETIFALIADLAQYDRWLPGSKSFGAITQISPLPVGLGTTYIAAGRNLATDGLQILAVRMTDAQYIRMEGKSSYILSRSLSCSSFSRSISARSSRWQRMPLVSFPLPPSWSCVYAKGQARTPGANGQLSSAPTMVSDTRTTLV